MVCQKQCELPGKAASLNVKCLPFCLLHLQRKNRKIKQTSHCFSKKQKGRQYNENTLTVITCQEKL